MKSRGQIFTIHPGYPIDIPVEDVARLIMRVPGRVRPVGLMPGRMVKWDSALFGVLQGELLEMGSDAHVAVYHPLTNELVRIPLAWLREVGNE